MDPIQQKIHEYFEEQNKLNIPSITSNHDINISWNWISVKDRLPEDEGEIVLVYGSKKNNNNIYSVWPAFYAKIYKNPYDILPDSYAWFSFETGQDIDNVTHWMFLPEKPHDLD